MKKHGHISLLSMLAGVVLAVSPAISFANLLFEDNFATDDLSKHNAYFRWRASGAITSPGEGASVIDQVSGPSGSPVNAVRFQYKALNSDLSGGGSYWIAELRFHLTSSLNEQRTQNGVSSTAYPEVWVSYWLRVPDNYAHGPVDPSNNKGFVTLWKNEYMGPVGAAIDWWRTGSSGSRIGAWAKENGVEQGNRDMPTFVRADHRVDSSGQAYAILPSERGQWVHVAVGAKISTNSTSRNGFIQIYKNGEKVVAWENLNNWNSDPSLQGFDRGYLFGWANSGYSADTTFYLTGFKFATSAAGAGVGSVSAPAVVSPPAAPVLRVN